jgi:hypothetical protein
MKEAIKEQWHLVTAILTLLIFILLAWRQDNIETKAPYESRPYTISCFTPDGWRAFKTFDPSPYGKPGIWLLENQDGSEFRSSMCQVEE